MMVARIQQAVMLSWLIVSAGILWVGVRFGYTGVALLIALSLPLLVIPVLAVEFGFMLRLAAPAPARRRGVVSVLRALVREVGALWLIFGWQQPFRSHCIADHVPLRIPGQAATTRRGVVLVHGLMCNRGFWNAWMRRLVRAKVPFVAVTLPHVFASIDASVDSLEHAVRRMEFATGIRPVLVAHSMGGLVVRAWLAAYSADDRVQRVITIGAPHTGTWLARFSSATNAQQMRLQSPWLKALAEREPAARYRAFTCFYSHWDHIVFPAAGATLAQALNREVVGVAHVDLAFVPEVYAELRRWLRLPDAHERAQESPLASG